MLHNAAGETNDSIITAAVLDQFGKGAQLIFCDEIRSSFTNLLKMNPIKISISISFS